MSTTTNFEEVHINDQKTQNHDFNRISLMFLGELGSNYILIVPPAVWVKLVLTLGLETKFPSFLIKTTCRHVTEFTVVVIQKLRESI